MPPRGGGEQHSGQPAEVAGRQHAPGQRGSLFISSAASGNARSRSGHVVRILSEGGKRIWPATASAEAKLATVSRRDAGAGHGGAQQSTQILGAFGKLHTSQTTIISWK